MILQYQFSIVQSIVKLQNSYRAFAKRQWYEQKQKRLQELEIKNKQKGTLVKKSFIQLSKITDLDTTDIYIANIFTQPIKGSTKKEQIFIELVPYITTKKKYDNATLKGVLIIDRSKTFNSGSQTFYDVLLSSLKLENGMLRLIPREEDFVQYEEKEESQPSINPNNFDEKIESKLVYNLEDETSLYNVLYTGKLPVQKRPQKLENYVEIGVNLKKIRKLYPDFNVQDKQIMKQISEQLVQGIRVRQNIEVDSKKIKSTLIKVVEKKITQPSQINFGEIKTQQKNKQVLMKGTKFYARSKFLVVIYYQELPVKRIIEKSKDQIFEEFEVFYEISANEMQNLKSLPITWKITPEEASNLCGLQSHSEVANYFMNRLSIINKKFLFSLEKKSDYLFVKPQTNVIFFYEIALRPLQRLVRNRQQLINRKSYKEELKQWKDENQIFLPGVFKYFVSKLHTLSKEFIVLSGEEKSKRIVIIAWKISNFHRYSIDVPKKDFLNYLTDPKKKEALMNLLLNRFIFYNEQFDTLSIEIPKEINLESEIDDEIYQIEQIRENEKNLASIQQSNS